MREALGIVCSECGRTAMRTIETRKIPGGIRRRKECARCGHRQWTFETIDTSNARPGVFFRERAA